MVTIRDILIDQLSKVPSLNSRYTNIHCINYPPPEGQRKRGNFSLVFHAIDNTTGEPVAIKFMDPLESSDVYRIDCFKREPKILKHLIGKKRCLQLVEELKKFNIEVETATGDKFPMQFEFFSTDWITNKIDDFFLAKEDLSPIEKMTIFRQVVLAVEAIHNSQIFHRDLKPDNIRADDKQGTTHAYVIDFGTAAQFDSNKILTEYADQVGANLYSAPEAFLGLAGERDVAKFTDFYALGCMLYELFNKQYHFNELTKKNPDFSRTLTVLALEFSLLAKGKDKLTAWKTTVEKFTKTVSPPVYQEAGCSLPSAINSLIERLFKDLTVFDFNKRLSDFARIRRILDTAIIVLQNDEISKKRIERKKLFKENKLKKIMKKEKALSEYIQRKTRLTC